jgi:hypothetical protein
MGGTESGLANFSISGLDKLICTNTMSVIEAGVKMEQAILMLSCRWQCLLVADTSDVVCCVPTGLVFSNCINLSTIWGSHSAPKKEGKKLR